jgi:hypothetical protein
MQRVDIQRKRTTLWPWLGGAVVLALIVWGVTGLLAAPQEEEERIRVTTAEDTLPPAAIPAPPIPVSAPTPRTGEDMAALGDEHIGQVVRAEGEVVATGTRGFWILVGSAVLRVDSERPVRRGQTLTLDAAIAAAEDERTDQIMDEVLSRNPQAEGWQVVRAVKLVDRNGAERTDG